MRGRSLIRGIDVSEPARERITVNSDTRFLSVVRQFLQRMIRQSALPPEDENKITLAVDEAVSNVIEHSYENQAEGTIEVEVEYDASLFRIIVRDNGKSFNPEVVNDPDIVDHVRLGKKRGLGIFLMRQIMDEVRYVFRDGTRNEVILTKHIRRRS